MNIWWLPLWCVLPAVTGYTKAQVKYSRTICSEASALLPAKASKHLEALVFYTEAGVGKVLYSARPVQHRQHRRYEKLDNDSTTRTCVDNPAVYIESIRTHRRPRAPLRLSRYARAAAIPPRSAPLTCCILWCHAQAACTAACLCSAVIHCSPATISLSRPAAVEAFCRKPGRCELSHQTHLSTSKLRMCQQIEYVGDVCWDEPTKELGSFSSTILTLLHRSFACCCRFCNEAPGLFSLYYTHVKPCELIA